MQIRLLSWNVNGIRATIKKGFWDSLKPLQANIVCLQETKTDADKMTELWGGSDFSKFQDGDSLFGLDNVLESSDELEGILNYWVLWHSASVKKGYSGVATLWPKTLQVEDALTVKNYQIGLGIEKFDGEGRLVLTEFSSKGQHLFSLINAYYPQGGRGPHRIEYKIEFYKEVKNLVTQLQSKGQKVILCGDFNTTVGDIDLARPQQNRKTTGCLPEEREALDWFIKDGFIDSFRYFYPDTPERYTYWDQITRARERNVGWRIDYFLVDKALESSLKSAQIWDQVMGSDHCPVTIDLEF